MTEQQRLKAIALCEQIQATIAKVKADADALKAAIDEFRQRHGLESARQSICGNEP